MSDEKEQSVVVYEASYGTETGWQWKIKSRKVLYWIADEEHAYFPVGWFISTPGAQPFHTSVTILDPQDGFNVVAESDKGLAVTLRQEDLAMAVKIFREYLLKRKESAQVAYSNAVDAYSAICNI